VAKFFAVAALGVGVILPAMDHELAASRTAEGEPEAPGQPPPFGFQQSPVGDAHAPRSPARGALQNFDYS